MTSADTSYLGRSGKRNKSDVGPTHFRDRLVERIFLSIPPGQHEEARAAMAEWTLSRLYQMIELLLSEGRIPPSGMLYARVEETVLEDAELSPQATALYTILAGYCYWPKRTCRPSLDTLATRFGTNRAHIIRWRDELVDRGHITYTAGKGKATNTYHLVHRAELIEAEGARTRNRITKRDQKKLDREFSDLAIG